MVACRHEKVGVMILAFNRQSSIANRQLVVPEPIHGPF